MGSQQAVSAKASTSKQSVYSLKRTFPAYILLVLSLVASFFVSTLVRDAVNADNLTAFEKATGSVVGRLQSAVREHEQVVNYMKGLYDELPFVVRDVFELSGSIAPRSFSSIQSVAMASRVPGDALGEFIFYARSERYYTYKLRPDGERDLYYPTYYLVPLEKNREMLGFDLASDSTIFDGIQRAVDNKNLAATAFYHIREPDTLGFMMMVPVRKYDAQESAGGSIRKLNKEGVIFIEVVAERFFHNALSAGGATDSDTSIVFRCVDRNLEGREQEVFRSANYPDAGDLAYDPLFERSIPVAYGDREIKVEFATVPGFAGELNSNFPTIALVVSIIFSFLLFAFTLSIYSSRGRAEDLAERITRSQRRIVESSKDIIGEMDLLGNFRAMNPAVTEILGYTPEEIKNMGLYDITIPEDAEYARKAFEEADDEQRLHYEIRTRTKDGAIRWISWNSTVSKTDGLIYCIGRDITEKKYAEEQIRLKTKQVELARQFSVESENYKSRFMADVSFYFRTALTGIIGYMQLINAKMYKSREQQEEFFKTAYHSSEDLLARVEDLLDVVEVERKNNKMLSKEVNLPIKNTFDTVVESLEENRNPRLHIDIMMDDVENYEVVANQEMLHTLVKDIIEAFTDGLAEATIRIFIQVNSFENVLEIQIVTSPNSVVNEMIEVYKRSSDENLIEVLKDDRNDIVFRIAACTSRIRIMSGSMLVDTLGKDGSVIMITLPIKKVSRFKKNLMANRA